MDVIGNNIANVNTTGYKTSRVVFQDIFSQSVKGGTANSPINGGTNPVQIGLGIKLSTIDVMQTPAPYARTDNPFDMMVEGDGFFIVQGPNGYFYTRAGNFKTDDEGYLTTSDGYYVMGYTGDFEYTPCTWDTSDPPVVADPASVVFDGINYSGLDKIRLRVPNPDPDAGPTAAAGTDQASPAVDLVGFAVGDDGSVSVIIDNEKVTIAKIALAMFSNPGGLEKAGNSLYRVTAASGNAVQCQPLMYGSGKVMSGGLEMSNVDLATEFTDMIVTQRGFQANSRIITVSDTMLEELVNLKR